MCKMTNKRYEPTLCDFDIKIKNKIYSFKINLNIPYSESPKHLSFRIIELHNLPAYIWPFLTEKLGSIIKAKNHEFFKSHDRNIMEEAKNKTDIDAVASSWANKLKIDIDKNLPGKCSDEWASTYHSLVHSSSVHSMLSLEHSYAEAVKAIVVQKEAMLEELLKKQSAEMQELVKDVSFSKVIDDKVNDLASQHLENAQIIEVQWDSTASALKEQQKRDYRKFIAEIVDGKETYTPVTPNSATFTGWGNSEVSRFDAHPAEAGSAQLKEESFTIHLGTQMKQMHNLRLLSADVGNLLTYQTHCDSEAPPQRIQTSMSLYSHNLNGLVLLVNDRVNSYTGIKKEFGRVCSMSTELHFSEMENQLESIRDLVPEVIRWRKDHPAPSYETPDERQGGGQTSQHLSSGDFYVTRHSNVPDVHVVFHLVVGQSLGSSDINSRHSAIVGLRNILKVACLNDVTTLTVPLLLTHTLTEEMTISWCQRRAELVFKCLKGFMIEMVSWGGADLKNLQFLVPEGISEELFNSLASLLQSIFRLSNPLVVKTMKT